MLKINRCDDRTGLGQIIRIQFDLADITDKQPFYIFIADI